MAVWVCLPTYEERENLEPLVRALRKRVPIVPAVVLSHLGDESVALGAVRLAVQSVEERLFGIVAEAV